MWSAFLLVLVAGGVREARGAETGDDESDAAPFMLLVEHEDGRHCAASLVSQRTALTSSECALYTTGEVLAWAAAARANGATMKVAARRVTRVATANSGSLALLELEDAFPASTHVRPILMASEASECSTVGRVCHAVRAIPRNGKPPRLRIVDATLAVAKECKPAVMDRALCLTGPEMCPGDWGAGAVCGGKLCGVVAGAAEAGCGRKLVAHNVARYRRFLHCAHVLKACGRGDCKNECTEQRLLEINKKQSTSNSDLAIVDLTGTSNDKTIPLANEVQSYLASLEQRSTKPIPTPARPSIPHPNKPILTTTSSEPGQRTAFMWEPNRADFKSGEYGDNVAEYDVEEQPSSNPVTEPSTTTTEPSIYEPETPEAVEEKTERTAKRMGSIHVVDEPDNTYTSPMSDSKPSDYDILNLPTRSTPRRYNLVRAPDDFDDAGSALIPSGTILLSLLLIL